MAKVKKSEVKTYAWNFRVVDEAALVLRAISQDSIGVVKLAKGQLEFWSDGHLVIKTASFGDLFAAIDRVETIT